MSTSARQSTRTVNPALIAAVESAIRLGCDSQREVVDLTPQTIEEIRARHAAATDTDGYATRFIRYEHGGGRLYREINEHGRSLILDAYEEADREFYFAAHADVRTLLARIDELEANREALTMVISTALSVRTPTPHPP